MHLREVSAVLDGVVSGHDAWSEKQNPRDVISKVQNRTTGDKDARESDLVEVVVEDLAKRATVVRPARLLTIDRINSLIPERCKPGQKPDPAGQCLREGWIQNKNCD